MTKHRDITFWTAIVFVIIVSSACSAFRNGTDGVCYKNVRTLQHVNVSYIETYRSEISNHWWPYCWFWNCYETKSHTAYKNKTKEVWVMEWTCCNGYENESETCHPKCKSKCMNGYCAQPNMCICNYGWGGNFCNESLLCSLRLHSSERISEPPELKNVKDVVGNFSLDWTLPKCHSNCRDQLSNMTVMGKARIEDFILYFLPIDSSCNLIVAADPNFWKKHSVLIGPVIGILILFSVGTCVLCIVQRRRKRRNEITEKPMQLKPTDYVEENPIYS